MDCIVVLSACPQDMIPVNGTDCTPTEVHYRVLDRTMALPSRHTRDLRPVASTVLPRDFGHAKAPRVSGA